jgi:ribosomal protein S18 acetylase RimI-like enzyme
MFASIALAQRIDAAEARLSESLGRAAIRTEPEGVAFVDAIGGGVAVYTGPASPMNKMIGAGFDGVPSEAELGDVEEKFRQRSAPLQAEVATLADPGFVAELTRRGYILQNFENVMGGVIRAAEGKGPAGIAIEVMGDESAEAWLDAALTGFMHPDGKGVPADELPPREAMEAAMRPFASVQGFIRYGAWIDGQLAGVASLRMDDGLAQLCGAATIPAFRRRGVQAALLRRRLADSVDAGCDLAVLTVQPGSTSQENGHRQGFALLYTRAILVKTGKGKG